MQYETMDKDASHDIGQRALAALRAALPDFDVQYRGGTYDPTTGTYSPRIVISLTQLGGKPIEQARFERYAALLGLPADAYGRTFEFGLSTYRLVGLMPHARKFPVLAQQMGGKKKEHPGRTYKLPLRAVEAMRTPLRLSEQIAAATNAGRRRA